MVAAGEIKERGNHEELLSQGGIYKELYESQFKDAYHGDMNLIG